MIKEYICKDCGFMTSDKEDMFNHLACIQKYKAENCTKKHIEIQRKKV